MKKMMIMPPKKIIGISAVSNTNKQSQIKISTAALDSEDSRRELLTWVVLIEDW